MATAPAKKGWRPRVPDAKDTAVLEALHAARVLSAPQLQRLYGLESVGSLHPRLVGLLGPAGTPRILERVRGPDGRYYYALGPVGYSYLPPADPPPVRHKPLARVRLAPQWLDHTLAVGWLLITWLTGGGAWQPAGSRLAYWGEHRAILPYPLPRRRGNVTHGRIEPDGALRLVQPDGQAWVGALEHDAGSEDAADWAAKLTRWAAVIRCGSWRERFGDTKPHLLITVPSAARRAQIAPWVAAGRKEHGSFYAFIAEHGAVSVRESDPLDAAPARLTAPAWVQVTSTPTAPLAADPFTLPAIIGATAPWRPGVAATPAPAAHALPDLEAEVLAGLRTQVRTQATQLTAAEETIRQLQAAGTAQHAAWQADRATLADLDRRYRLLQTAYARLLASTPTARLQRYWRVRHPLGLAGRGLVLAVGLLLLGAGLTALWVIGAQVWATLLDWDMGLAVFLDTHPTVLALLTRVWLAPWCGGPLVLGSALGTLAAWRWARRYSS